MICLTCGGVGYTKYQDEDLKGNPVIVTESCPCPPGGDKTGLRYPDGVPVWARKKKKDKSRVLENVIKFFEEKYKL